MISKDKQYRTRDGREVRIYATDGGGNRPIHAAYCDNNSKKWWASVWSEKGFYNNCYEPTDLDLIEVKPRHKRTVWLNVYDNHVYGAYSKEHADVHPHADSRIACVKVEIDCEEGEGL